MWQCKKLILKLRHVPVFSGQRNQENYWALSWWRLILLWYGWPTKGDWPYFQLGPPSEIRVCSSDKITPIYFLRLSKVWSMLHHGSMWLVHKQMLLNTFMYYFGFFFFFFFHHKICVFIIFISFPDKVYQISDWFPTVSSRIVWSSPSPISDTPPHEQDLKLHRTWVQAVLNEVV